MTGQSKDSDLAGALRALDGQPRRIDADAWPGNLTNLESPGLYTWWVSAGGASDLARGLGLPLEQGRIYAGQAGATKWPSGTRGSATLSSRINRNHLHGRVRSSTFRLTLGAILRAPLVLEVEASKRLSGDAEGRLTAWMREHLEVAVYPVPDRDGLGELEGRVLDALDPPLNLDRRPGTPVRRKLTELRRLIASPAADAR